MSYLYLFEIYIKPFKTNYRNLQILLYSLLKIRKKKNFKIKFNLKRIYLKHLNIKF